MKKIIILSLIVLCSCSLLEDDYTPIYKIDSNNYRGITIPVDTIDYLEIIKQHNKKSCKCCCEK